MDVCSGVVCEFEWSGDLSVEANREVFPHIRRAFDGIKVK